MLLLNRFAVSLRHFQKLTKPRRWHHTSLTKHKEDIMKNVVNSPPFTCISYNRSEWGAVRFCYQHFSKYLLCALRKKVILVCNDKSAYELIENMDKKATWDRFYAENGSKGKFKNFEWFFGFHAVQEFILPVIQTMSHFHSHPLHILDMGCGTSALGPCVYKHSPCAVNVTCADISPVAIRLLGEHTNTSSLRSQNPSSVLSFIEMDCTQLRGQFESRSLDLILDKGTTDALVRSNEGRVKAGQIIRQCLQVLRTSGSLLQFSDEDPDARLVWLEREVRETDQAADVGVQEVGELRGVSYFCYQITPCVASHLKL